MPKLHIYNTRDTTCSFSKEQKKITPLLLESYWVSRRKNSSNRFELGTLETVHQLPIYVRLWIVSQSHFNQEWKCGRNTTSTQILLFSFLLTAHQISYQDKVLLFCYFWSFATRKYWKERTNYYAHAPHELRLEQNWLSTASELKFKHSLFWGLLCKKDS